MDVQWHPEAVQDLQQYDTSLQREIVDDVDELRQQTLSHDNVSLFRKQGLDIFRLKIKEDGSDHRVFFDIFDSTVVILGAFHRDTAYTDETVQKIQRRL